jgi:hypothetical protein
MTTYDGGQIVHDQGPILCLREWWPWTEPWWAQSTGGSADPGPLRRRCRSLVRQMKVPRPFDLQQFKSELEQTRGRQIKFVPVKTTSKSPCGLHLAVDDVDYVFFEASTSPLHQVHIALHELGHVCFGHEGISPFSVEFLARAMPNLDPAALRRVLGRTSFTAAQEQEAEMFATVVGEKGAITEVAHKVVEFTPDTAQMLSRLAAGLAEASGW